MARVAGSSQPTLSYHFLPSASPIDSLEDQTNRLSLVTLLKDLRNFFQEHNHWPAGCLALQKSHTPFLCSKLTTGGGKRPS